MKRLILTTTALLFGGLIAFSQDKATVEKQTAKRLDMMTKGANINPEQQTKMRPVIENFVKANMMNEEKNHGKNPEEFKKEEQENSKTYMEGQRKVMTPPQFQRWMQWQHSPAGKMASKDM